MDRPCHMTSTFRGADNDNPS